jgi:hypothetical protein
MAKLAAIVAGEEALDLLPNSSQVSIPVLLLIDNGMDNRGNRGSKPVNRGAGKLWGGVDRALAR